LVLAKFDVTHLFLHLSRQMFEGRVCLPDGLVDLMAPEGGGKFRAEGQTGVVLRNKKVWIGGVKEVQGSTRRLAFFDDGDVPPCEEGHRD
jgi:hypothetical protein